ncbi:uncharacterized protein BKA55DRAFT_526577 [Fusarium redolens]|uniref:Uncharacterized protein n=1 Tax=Fusarium redolens TaxID=48865 RepID=A0A9P9G253_FUSRE|nr:uncharacterized protein BKA55DRAFT_526577 [Fusarium redolens]KAH7228589.1 hypothetical protein BKA55DRAFT_526577 [Fusarium redolens]
MRIPRSTLTANQGRCFEASQVTSHVTRGGEIASAIFNKWDDAEGTCINVSEDVGRLEHPPPLKELPSRKVLKLICLREAWKRGLIDPGHHVQEIRKLGSEQYALQLLESMEKTLELSPEPSRNLEERIDLTKQRLRLLQCPQDKWPNHNEPKFSVWGGLVVLEHYETHESNFLDWPLKYLDSHALIFTAQAFGRLGYMFPSNIDLDKVSSFFNVLICIHQDSLAHAATRRLNLTMNPNSCNQWLVEALGLCSRSDYQRYIPKIVGLNLQFGSEFGLNSDRILWLPPAPEARSKDQIFKTTCVGTREASSTLLRDYRELEGEHHLLKVPDDFSFWSFVRRLQDFPQTTTSIVDWPNRNAGVAAIRYIIECYHALGYQASVKDVLVDDPIRVLSNIYFMSAQKSAAHGRYDQLKTPPSSECGGIIEETSDLEQSITGTPPEERGVQTADDLTLCEYGHNRVATCANLTSISLDSWRNRRDSHQGDDVDLAALLRACHLLFRAEEDEARRGRRKAEPCIKCTWEDGIENQHGVEWAISQTESLLSMSHLPDHTLYHRMAACEEKLNVQNLSKLKPDCLFKSIRQVITVLNFTHRFRLKEKDESDVYEDAQAQTLFAVSCLSELNRSPPEDLQSRLLEIFNKIIVENDRQTRQWIQNWPINDVPTSGLVPLDIGDSQEHEDRLSGKKKAVPLAFFSIGLLPLGAAVARLALLITGLKKPGKSFLLAQGTVFLRSASSSPSVQYQIFANPSSTTCLGYSKTHTL